MAPRKLSHEGTLVLDSEGLSKLVTDSEPVVALVAEARRLVALRRTALTRFGQTLGWRQR